MQSEINQCSYIIAMHSLQIRCLRKLLSIAQRITASTLHRRQFECKVGRGEEVTPGPIR
jgi:hypothetical protein